VFLFDEPNGKALLRYVKMGIQDDQYIQIVEGMTDNEQVITGPYDEIAKSLNNGDVVKKGDVVSISKSE
jgi:HlyD family secretion protein